MPIQERSLLLVLGAAVLFAAGGIAVWNQTDLRQQIGWTDADLENRDDGHHQHDHAHADHAHADDHAHGDDHAHAGQAHADHAHADHAHADHAHAHPNNGDVRDDPSLPPSFAGGDLVTSVSEPSHPSEGPSGGTHQDHDDHGHDHGHDHAGEGDSIPISRQARANIGIETATVQLGTYTEYVEIPGVVTTWPGRTHIMVTSPLTGVVNSIHVVRGQLVPSGAPLLSIRLTHQDLVKLQEEFVADLGQLDVIEREIRRLTSIARSGAVAGKTLINRQYERDQLSANLRAVRQSLVLHGLTEDQVEKIETSRRLIREIKIYAPELHQDDSLHHDSIPHAHGEDGEHVDGEFLVTSFDVDRGQAVESGVTLARLSDYRTLLIEGHAFQRDAHLLQLVAESNAPIQATLRRSSDATEEINDLEINFIGNEVDRSSRALAFYVELNNKVERLITWDDRQFLSWRFKPGQRLQLRLPKSSRNGVIVISNEGVAEVGPNRYVFVDHGDHFDRVAVHIAARDSRRSAISDDGSLNIGQRVAISRAHQLQMAFRNRDGGGVDPHAGHSH